MAATTELKAPVWKDIPAKFTTVRTCDKFISICDTFICICNIVLLGYAIIWICEKIYIDMRIFIWICELIFYGSVRMVLYEHETRTHISVGA